MVSCPSPEQPFSPNVVYFKAMLLWELAQPYLDFARGAYAVVYWVFPWKRCPQGDGWFGRLAFKGCDRDESLLCKNNPLTRRNSPFSFEHLFCDL